MFRNLSTSARPCSQEKEEQLCVVVYLLLNFNSTCSSQRHTKFSVSCQNKKGFYSFECLYSKLPPIRSPPALFRAVPPIRSENCDTLPTVFHQKSATYKKNYFWGITQSTEFCLARKSIFKIFSCGKKHRIL